MSTQLVFRNPTLDGIFHSGFCVFLLIELLADQSLQHEVTLSLKHADKSDCRHSAAPKRLSDPTSLEPYQSSVDCIPRLIVLRYGTVPP